MRKLPWAVGATVLMLVLPRAEAAAYTLASPESHSRISVGWASDDGVYSSLGLVAGDTKSVTGTLNVAWINGPLGTPVTLQYESPSNVYSVDHKVEVPVYQGTTLVGTLAAELDLWMTPYGSVAVQGPQAALVSSPAQVATLLGPTRSYSFTPVNGDPVTKGNIFPWRLGSEFQHSTSLRSNLVSGNDITKTLDLAMALQGSFASLLIGGVPSAGTLTMAMDMTLTSVPVPEPATWALWLTGIAALAGMARRRSGAG